jgi:hypothetical protein
VGRVEADELARHLEQGAGAAVARAVVDNVVATGPDRDEVRVGATAGWARDLDEELGSAAVVVDAVVRGGVALLEREAADQQGVVGGEVFDEGHGVRP